MTEAQKILEAHGIDDFQVPNDGMRSVFDKYYLSDLIDDFVKKSVEPYLTELIYLKLYKKTEAIEFGLFLRNYTECPNNKYIIPGHDSGLYSIETVYEHYKEHALNNTRNLINKK